MPPAEPTLAALPNPLLRYFLATRPPFLSVTLVAALLGLATAYQSALPIHVATAHRHGAVRARRSRRHQRAERLLRCAERHRRNQHRARLSVHRRQPVHPERRADAGARRPSSAARSSSPSSLAGLWLTAVVGARPDVDRCCRSLRRLDLFGAAAQAEQSRLR